MYSTLFSTRITGTLTFSSKQKINIDLILAHLVQGWVLHLFSHAFLKKKHGLSGNGKPKSFLNALQQHLYSLLHGLKPLMLL